MPTVKLKPADVEAIKKLYADGAKQLHIAAKYNVTQQQISRIVRNERWKRLRKVE